MPTAPRGSGARLRVICHTMTSIDGRMVTDGWPLSKEGRRSYEQIHAGYAPDGWLFVLVAPVVDGGVGTPALFDVEGDALPPQRLALEAVARRADDVLWPRYRVVSR